LLIKKITEKDKKDWLNFLENKEKLFDKDNKNNKKLYNLEKTIDLHGYNLDEANQIVEKYIFQCFSEGVKKIIIITGKGNRSKNKDNPFKSQNLGILKHSVPDYIKSNPNLMKLIKKINYDDIDKKSKGSFEINLKKN